ncbi:chitobiase/beta-hexosaminidase C-terminal domain-containing protein [Cohnella panacarvi]|uniref:chitobiase/beta-hexosaminidase C-terminal domain-containing protein n=1 Tax=Cohnella panacarvi TaxID=400776 RepID=UPI00047D85C1|nr:chitobiase/beta-hexosaminidase C-terminal domain-containing protein [Cohnella panacarvi]
MKKRIICMLMAMLLCLPFAVANAETKTSADFSDLKDLDAATKAKFDALISAGVFDGVGEGKFGVKDEMNRAQFAKVAALIFNLQVDPAVKASSFKDVKADDPANGYALPYIEAVKKAGIAEGVGQGSFDPAGKVTKEQLATFLVRGLGMNEDAKKTPGVNDITVSDWAKGYVALALDKKIMSNGSDGRFGGTSNATRDLLVTGAYEAKVQYVAQEEQKTKEEERKKKEEEEQKKKEEEDKKQEESTPPPSSSPSYETVAMPSASVAGGEVAFGTSVALSTATSGAVIHYTDDGSMPTASSPIYSEPIPIFNSVTIKAIAIKSGANNSAVMTKTYTVPGSIEPKVVGAQGPSYSAGSRTVDIEVTASVTGSVYSVVVEGSAPPPGTELILDGYDAYALDAQVLEVSAGMPRHVYIEGLPADDTTYTVYLIVTDGTAVSDPFIFIITTPPASMIGSLNHYISIRAPWAYKTLEKS